MSGRHGSDAVKAFLNQEVAQVWALHRTTGEPMFLDKGRADAVRQTAKEHWRCPVPGCEVPISTRGGSRRDHFFHLGEGNGHSDGESMFHLQAKAMLADWARRQDPSVVVTEELTVKDPAASRTRRPDVLAAWPEGRRVAFEVEYKAYTPADWRAKQHDFDQMSPPVLAVWLFGHLHRYLALAPRPAGLAEDQPWDEIVFRELPRAVAAAGMPMLHVNPVDRTVGTVVIDGVPLDQMRKRPRWSAKNDLSHVGLRLPRAGDFHGRLVVCQLDDCRLDPERGLVTPAMAEVEASRAAVEAAAAVDREKDRLAEERAAAIRAKQPSKEDRKAYALAAAERDQQKWLDDPLRAGLVRHYGKVPPVLAKKLDGDHGVHGHHEHWHCVAFLKLVSKKVGRTWTVPQVYAVIAESFKLHKEPEKRSHAISGFLRHLKEHGFVDFDDCWNGIEGPVTVLHDDVNAPPPPPSTAEPVLPAAEAPPRVRSELPGHEWARRLRISIDAERDERARSVQDSQPAPAPTSLPIATPMSADGGVGLLLRAGLSEEAAAALSELLAPGQSATAVTPSP